MITDILIIGGGGAGARCAIECNKEVIIASKGLFGKSGCTVMAEGGYNAVINPEDSFEKHFEDTIKGGGYINDEKLVKILVENSPKELENLENFGALFDKKDSKTLAQRPFGGQSFNRTCYSGDRTGHEIIAGLMEYLSKKNNIKIMEDITAIKLIVKNNICYGAIFINNITGHIFPIFSKATVISTGGAGQIYPITSNPIQKVGDGFALAYNEGAILKDMEMVQFHPTGMVGTGTLVTEAVRGEGGILYNKNKERFMEKYDPIKMELSTRDVVAKAIYNEIIEGRGINNEGVYLDVSHLNEETIKYKLETMYHQFLDVGVDITKEPMVVSPTAHHTMGGIKINEKCETNIIGLFACGEVAGGIHGANRLGGNALADTQVFGAIAGKSANNHCEIVTEIKYYNLEKANEYTKDLITNIKKEIVNLKNNKYDDIGNNTENINNLINHLRNTMWKYVSIVRTEQGLNKALNEINILKSKKENLKLNNLGDVLKYFDFKSMLIVSELIVKCALIRKESRGAHYMADYPNTLEEFKGNTIAHNGKITFVPIK